MPIIYHCVFTRISKKGALKHCKILIRLKKMEHCKYQDQF